MFDPETPVPWNHPVEMFEAGADLRVNTRPMTLRQAVECFAAIPEDARASYGVSVGEPYLTTMNGRPVAVGFLNASALAVLIDMLPAD